VSIPKKMVGPMLLTAGVALFVGEEEEDEDGKIFPDPPFSGEGCTGEGCTDDASSMKVTDPAFSSGGRVTFFVTFLVIFLTRGPVPGLAEGAVRAVGAVLVVGVVLVVGMASAAGFALLLLTPLPPLPPLLSL
jgi:hypothetical protein